MLLLALVSVALIIALLLICLFLINGLYLLFFLLCGLCYGLFFLLLVYIVLARQSYNWTVSFKVLKKGIDKELMSNKCLL